jgi:hypothetical protein
MRNKQPIIFCIGTLLAPISPLTYGVIRGAGDFIRPYLFGSAVVAYAVCLAIAIPYMRMITRRTTHRLVHLIAAIVFIVGYAGVCGTLFAYAENLAEMRAIQVGYSGDNGPREFWDDSGMSAWPTPWDAILQCSILTSIIWLPVLAITTALSSLYGWYSATSQAQHH